MADDIEIHRAARKHRVADADIRHAIVHFLYAADVDPGEPTRALYLGPDRAGNLLELIAIERADGTTLVIHAMNMRRQFELLPKQDQP
jgi:hypothetical protein